jgi:hypothetical protein
VLIARALAGDAVRRTVVDLDHFRFDGINSVADEMMLPGALKYGGLPRIAGLCAPGELYLHNEQGTGVGDFARTAYQAASAANRLQVVSTKADIARLAEWLCR